MHRLPMCTNKTAGATRGRRKAPSAVITRTQLKWRRRERAESNGRLSGRGRLFTERVESSQCGSRTTVDGRPVTVKGKPPCFLLFRGCTNPIERGIPVRTGSWSRVYELPGSSIELPNTREFPLAIMQQAPGNWILCTGGATTVAFSFRLNSIITGRQPSVRSNYYIFHYSGNDCRSRVKGEIILSRVVCWKWSPDCYGNNKEGTIMFTGKT